MAEITPWSLGSRPAEFFSSLGSPTQRMTIQDEIEQQGGFEMYNLVFYPSSEDSGLLRQAFFNRLCLTSAEHINEVHLECINTFNDTQQH